MVGTSPGTADGEVAATFCAFDRKNTEDAAASCSSFRRVRGQVIFVDPALGLVLVQTAVWKTAGDRAARAELLALWRGVVEHYGKW